MKTMVLVAVFAITATSSDAADALFLPSPAGSTVAGGWIPTNAQIVDGELLYDGPWLPSWSASTELPASHSNGWANWTLTSSFTGSNFTGTNAIYTGTRTNTTFTVSTTDYSGPAFRTIVFQLTVNSDNDRDLLLAPALQLGGHFFTAAQASFTTDRAFGGGFSDPTNRYHGHFGGLALVTYEWDLHALGYSGSYSDISLSWALPLTHSSLYDAQISFAAVPEPSTFWALAIGGVFIAQHLVRRRVPHSETPNNQT